MTASSYSATDITTTRRTLHIYAPATKADGWASITGLKEAIAKTEEDLDGHTEGEAVSVRARDGEITITYTMREGNPRPAPEAPPAETEGKEAK